MFCVTLTSNAPETKDNDFTWKDFQARNNNELVFTVISLTVSWF
jgi:methionyl-tRNA synthetase